jgi:class 3 adenylate cyclase
MTEDNESTRVGKLLELARNDPAVLRELEQFRRNLVVMFTDVQGSTAYFEKHGDAAGLFMVHQCNQSIRLLVEKHGGTAIKTIGDGSMVTFPEPKSAVEAAVEIQMAVSELAAARPQPERIALRIGMHYGSGIVRTTDVFGDVVNMASRVESVAGPGQIVISEEVYALLGECRFPISQLGRFALKGKTGRRTLYQVVWKQSQVEDTQSSIAIPISAGTPVFKLQLLHQDGTGGEEFPVKSELFLGLSTAGGLVVSDDSQSISVCARVFVDERTLFVENRSDLGGGVFLRLSSLHVLEHQDVFLAGRQLFRYEEKTEAAASAPDLTAALAETLSGPKHAAELVRIDTMGKSTGRYQLNRPEVGFGRSIGTYVFPDDNRMSRRHVRITQRANHFLLEDLESRNGTFVKVRGKAALPAGSALRIAGQLLQVRH